MIEFLTVILIISAVFLVIVILMQQGKGQEMGAVFGGSSQTVFGASGAGNFLTKTTAVLAIVFMGSAFLISYFSANQQNQIKTSYIKKQQSSVVNKSKALNRKALPKKISSTGNSKGGVVGKGGSIKKNTSMGKTKP